MCFPGLLVHFVDSELFRPNPDPTYQNVFLIRKQVTGHMLVTLFFEIFFVCQCIELGLDLNHLYDPDLAKKA